MDTEERDHRPMGNLAVYSTIADEWIAPLTLDIQN